MKKTLWNWWQQKTTSVRSRIFLFYIVLMSVFLGVFIPASIKLVFRQVDRRVEADLAIETKLFIGMLNNDLDTKKRLRINHSNLTYPHTTQQLIEYFNLFHAHRTPEDDTYIISVLDQDFYRAVPEALPPEIDLQSAFFSSLLIAPVDKKGMEIIGDSTDILYSVKLIKRDQKTLGRLIVVHLVEGERREAIAVLQIIIGVIVVVFLLSLVVTWIVAGKVLSPLSSMLKTALNIDEKNLTQRLNVTVSGELADLAEAFNKMLDRLELAFKSQQNFINDASHELRTPITIIRGHLELLLIDQNMEIDRDTIHLTIDELDRMNRLVNDLLLLARAERPDFLVWEVIELSFFIPNLFAKIQALAERQWQLTGQIEGSLYADRQRLTQAVINLAQNAVQHTQPNDTITLGVAIDSQCFSLWVSDTGEGIPAAEQDRIFQRFARVRNSQRRSEGSGLGLAIVQRIVLSHKGTISLHSQEGVGSTFCIMLPLKYPANFLKPFSLPCKS